MKVVCAECRKWYEKEPLENKTISHGFCPSCYIGLEKLTPLLKGLVPGDLLDFVSVDKSKKNKEGLSPEQIEEVEFNLSDFRESLLIDKGIIWRDPVDESEIELAKSLNLDPERLKLITLLQNETEVNIGKKR